MQKEHNPPHLHALYGEYDAEIDIRTGKQIKGNLPVTALSLVSKWISIHRDELMEMWERQQFKQLPPLEYKMEFVFHRVKSVGIVEGTVLIAQFEEGICKTYDVKELATNIPAFKSLIKDKDLFAKVHVEGSGFGIVWNDDFDLSCNELWDNGIIVPTLFDNLLALSDATELWGLNESTLRKAISYGKLRIGFDVCNYGKQWVVTKDAMIREYGPLTERDEKGQWDCISAVAEQAQKYGGSSELKTNR